MMKFGKFGMQAPGIFTGSEVRIREPDLPTIHFAVAFQGAAASDPDAIALTVLQTMIGSWEKSAGAGTPPPPPHTPGLGFRVLTENSVFNRRWTREGNEMYCAKRGGKVPGWRCPGHPQAWDPSGSGGNFLFGAA